jgi:hypothetical protein
MLFTENKEDNGADVGGTLATSNPRPEAPAIMIGTLRRSWAFAQTSALTTDGRAIPANQVRDERAQESE